MIATVQVFLNHLGSSYFVGKLASRDKRIFFEYDSDFIKQNIEISPYHLPLISGLQECKERVFDGIFGVFADSLPDGWGRLLLDRHLIKRGIHNASQLDRLLFVGKFGIGALSYEPMLDEPISLEDEIVLDDLASSSIEILNGSSYELLDTLLAINGSSAGARPKIMVQINSADQIIHGSQALQDGYDHYIIKFPNSNDGIDSGKIEYIYSQMAQKAGVEIPKTKLLKGKKGSYFAIKRFDRVGDKRVHIHSVAGLVHSDFRLPSLDYDDLLKLTFHLTKNKNEVTKLYKLAVFNLLTHNRDDHAKNFSFLLDTNHNWKLAPAYDLTYSYGVGTEHSTTYLNEGKNPTETHLTELAKRHDIRDYKTIIDQTKEAVAEFGRLAEEIELPLATSSSLQKVLNRAD